MLPFDEIDSLLSPAQKQVFAAQNDITAQMAETIALYVYIASTGEYHAAEAIEAEFNRFYNRRMTDFINAAPNIAAETVMNYSRESYEATATPTMPPFEQNAPIYRTAAVNAEQAQRIVSIISPGNTGITEQLPGGIRFTPTQDFFRRELNDGIQNVIAGNKTYTQVIRDVVRKMSNSGIRTMTTPPTENLPNGRTERIDVIVRRAVMGGIKSAITENAKILAAQMGTTFFEISWHEGHRDTHRFGGRRYSTVKTDVIDVQTGKPFLTEQETWETYGYA